MICRSIGKAGPNNNACQAGISALRPFDIAFTKIEFMVAQMVELDRMHRPEHHQTHDPQHNIPWSGETTRVRCERHCELVEGP